MIHKKKNYRNAATAASGDEFIGPPIYQEPVKQESKVWGILDNIFGVADKSVDLYSDIRSEQKKPTSGLQTDVYVGNERPSNKLPLIIGGVVVAALVIFAIYKLKK
jgi:hypothetical protein